MKTPTHTTKQDIWEQRYKKGRVMLYALFLLSSVYFLFLILFPTQSLTFDFKNPSASKNTLLDPHSQKTDTLVNKGNIPQGSALITDAPLSLGDYSLLTLQLTTDSKFSASKADFLWPQGALTLKKSYRAFFLPQGEDVTTPNPNQAAIQSSSLLSFADGVFLIDGQQVRPIGDASIFEGLGYTWGDVRPASEEDMGAFTKGKIIELGNMHPDGTVLYDPATLRYFLILHGEKHRIASHEIAQSYLRNSHPILISEASETTEEHCDTTLEGWLQSSYTCDFMLHALASLPGDSYRITAQFNDTVALQDMNGTFTHTMSKATLFTSLSQIKQRILTHFGVTKTN